MDFSRSDGMVQNRPVPSDGDETRLDRPSRAALPPGSPLPQSRLNPFLSAVIEDYATTFRDNDVAQSVDTAHHLWWNARIPLARYVEILHQAASVTKATVSRGQVRKGNAGERDAMPYFFSAVRTLCQDLGDDRDRGGPAGTAASG
jgi:hypothetical protein